MEIDPQFAQAQLTLHSAYLLANQAGKSMPPLQKAMDYEYRLPERTRYDMRAEYFMMKQDKEKAFAVAKMKVQLYPEDLSAYGMLAQFQRLRGDKAGLIESLKKILELDPSQQEAGPADRLRVRVAGTVRQRAALLLALRGALPGAQRALCCDGGRAPFTGRT